MGIITVEKSDRLLWLGRYTERVYTTLKYYFQSADKMIDANPGYYGEFCRKIGIANIYGTRENFLKTYPFDENDPNSILSSLNKAYDNAILMRDYIGTETMAYIQLAIDDMHHAKNGSAAFADLMLTIDHILAFWGCVNDMIDNEQVRNIIKLGKGVERLDLYLSLEMPDSDVKREYRRMKQFLVKSRLRYDESVINTADILLDDSPLNQANLKKLLRGLISE